jgi:hypothetical protein
VPLAVSSALWSSFDGVNRLPFNSRPKPLCEFRLPPESYPTDPSRPTAVRQLLSWAFGPFSTYKNRRSTKSRASPARYVPPSGFGYPLDGLLPSIPGRLCFKPAALLGFSPSELDRPAGIQPFPTERTHLPFHLPMFPSPKRRAGPPGYDFWAFSLRGVPSGARWC